MEKLLINVRRRGEYIMEQIKGVIHISHYDLEHYSVSLPAHEMALYCNFGRHESIAAKKLAAT